MAGEYVPVGTVAAALRGLPAVEREVFLAMLDAGASYPAIAAGLGIDVAEAERAFAAALVHLADSLDAPSPGDGARRWLRRVAAAARLARRSSAR